MRTFFLGFALVCGACATPAADYYPLAESDTALVLNGVLGAVVLDLDVGTCTSVDLSLQNLDSGRQYRWKEFPAGNDMAGEAPIVQLVPPGNYRFAGGSCTLNLSTYSYGGTITTTSLDDMSLWLRPFHVGGGEVVYPGSPQVVDQVVFEWGIALTPQEKLSGRKLRSNTKYRIFDVVDKVGEVQGALQTYNPKLLPRLVKQIRPVTIDATQARKIIADAFAPYAEIPPDDQTAYAHREAAQRDVAQGLRNHLMQQLEADLK
jgi:hypothetical protein